MADVILPMLVHVEQRLLSMRAKLKARA